MPRFFVENADKDRITVTGDDARHIGRSLRMKTGEHLTLVCEGKEYECEITGFTDSEVYCSVKEIHDCKSEPETKLTLFQAMPKGDKAELIVQKAVELGADEICFVLSERCISRPDDKSAGRKMERLSRIALEAAKQCGRGIIPRVRGIISFDEMTKELCGFDRAIMCYEKGGAPLSSLGIEKGQRIALMIGSEGGFEKQEADAFVSSGGVLAGLGSRILRCETAPLAAMSIIMSLAGEME